MTYVTRTVQITKADIEQGKPKVCTLCPGAIAINRSFPECKWAEVLKEEVRVYVPIPSRPQTARAQTVDAPEVLQNFIEAFDTGMPVEPISFDLTFNMEVPECLPSA